MIRQCPQCGVALREGDTAALCPACRVGDADETLLTMGAAANSTAHPVAAPRSAEGDSFGPYQLVRAVGEGGMGSVYLAEQLRPIRRQVALKVVKLGMDSRQVLARFEGERQSLALMDHPNIAHVFDAGTSDGGRPYFVMEYVEGVPITDYCDAHHLSTRERLELFILVCHALQHAHQKGVIHRDVKPSNILVGMQDGKPVPKVIDFGIAKATDQRAAEGPAFTQMGQFVGTPEYMSPEQADLSSLNVDTGTDVYSLGVVLYELLVGALPFDPKFLRKAGLAELLRIIREEEAPPPSAKLTSLGDTITQITQCRRTDIRTLRRDLTGDLNWIVMKAIEKERRRRYASASELAADIQRYLDDQPVMARPPSTLYTTSKFVRRHKAAVAGAACVAAALVVGVVGIAWEAHVARQEREVALVQRQEAVAQRAEAENQRKEADAQRQRAETQSALALTERGRAEAKATEAEEQRQQAEGLFNNVRGLAGSMLFKVDDQIAELQGSTPARETLVNEATAYLDRLVNSSRSDPKLRLELASAFLKVGDLQGATDRPNLHDPDGARASYAKAFELLDPLLRSGAADAESRHVLVTAYLHRASLQESQDARRTDRQKALELAETEVKQQPKSLQARQDLMHALMAIGNRERSLSIAESLLADDPQSPDNRRDLAEIERRLGNSLGSTDMTNTGSDPAKALEWYQKSLAILDKLTREFPANAQYRRNQASVMGDEANVINKLNRHDEAIGEMRRAVALQQELAAGDSRNIGFRMDLANLQGRLSFMLNFAGRRDEATATAKQSFAVVEKLAAEQPKNVEVRADKADFNNMYAELWSSLGSQELAVPYARTSLAQYEELAHDQPQRLRWQRAVASVHFMIGGLLFRNNGATAANNDRAAGLEQFRQALALRQKIWDSGRGEPEDLALLADAHWSLGQILSAIGNSVTGVQQYREAMALLEKVKADYPNEVQYISWITSLYTTLASSAEQDGKWGEAAAYARQALPRLEEDYAKAPRTTDINSLVSLLRSSGAAAFHLGDTATASQQFQRMVTICEGRSADSVNRTIQYVSSLGTLADYQRESGDRAGALATWQRAEAVLDKQPTDKLSVLQQRSSIAYAYDRIGEARTEMMENPAALPAFRKSVAIREVMYKADPASATWRGTLRQDYPRLARCLWLMGDLAGARDNFRAPLNMPELGDKAFSLLYAGNIQYSLARVRSALGEAAAGEDFRKAIDWYQKSESAGQKLWNASKADITVLRDMVVAQQNTADLFERLGQRKLALDYRRKILANEIVRSGEGSEDVESAQATLARLEQQPAGLDVARGYRILGELRTDQLDLAPAREALTKALEMDTALLAVNPRKLEYRLEQALTLRALGTLHLRRADAVAARESSTRARTLILELVKELALPDRHFALPGLLAVDIASADAIAERRKAVSAL